MDMSLTAEQDAVRKAVQEWVDDVVVPRALSNDREERFPQEALDGLKQTGFIGMSIPEEYGGGGADPLSYVLLIEELGPRRRQRPLHRRRCTSAWSPASIDRMGTEEQKEQLAAADGDRRGAGLLRPDRARLRQRRRQPAGHRREAAERRLPPQRPQDLHHQRHHRRPRACSWPAPAARAARASARSSCRPTRPASTANKIHGKLGLRSCDTAELVLRRRRGRRRTRCSAARRAPASRPRCRRSTTAACRSRASCTGHHARPASTRWSATRRSASSSASRSPATSSCRSSSPTPPSSSTAPGC